jgi:hypothetical protein
MENPALGSVDRVSLCGVFKVDSGRVGKILTFHLVWYDAHGEYYRESISAALWPQFWHVEINFYPLVPYWIGIAKNGVRNGNAGTTHGS